MANPKLLFSSGINGLIIISALTYFQLWVPSSFLYVSGILTSLWNHGYTSELAKWADRVVIALIFIHNVVLSALNFLNLWPAIASNMIGVTFYFMAKYYEK